MHGRQIGEVFWLWQNADNPPSRRRTVASPCSNEWVYIRDYKRKNIYDTEYHFTVYYSEVVQRYKTTFYNKSRQVHEGEIYHDSVSKSFKAPLHDA